VVVVWVFFLFFLFFGVFFFVFCFSLFCVFFFFFFFDLFLAPGAPTVEPVSPRTLLISQLPAVAPTHSSTIPRFQDFSITSISPFLLEIFASSRRSVTLLSSLPFAGPFETLRTMYPVCPPPPHTPPPPSQSLQRQPPSSKKPPFYVKSPKVIVQILFFLRLRGSLSFNARSRYFPPLHLLDSA